MKYVCLATFLCVSGFASFSQTTTQRSTQPYYYEGDRGFTFHAGAGYSPLIGPISGSLENGWNFQAGGGYMFNPYLGVIADYQYNGLGVPRRVLNALAEPDGSAWVYSVTVGPEIRLAPDSRIDPYIIGGIGWYRRTVEFTRPTLTTVTVFDPFFGFFFPAVVPANLVVGTITRDGFGGNAGLGVNYRLREGSHAKIFAEVRYHQASHEHRDTQMLPFTIGLRW